MKDAVKEAKIPCTVLKLSGLNSPGLKEEVMNQFRERWDVLTLTN